MLSWTFFRATSLTQATQILLRIFTLRSGSGLTVPSHVWILVAAFLAAEWIQRGRTHALEFPAGGPPRWTRWLICYTVIFLLLKYGGEQQDFIYFQF